VVLIASFANLGDSSSARATCCPGPGQSGDDRCCFVGAPRPVSSSSSVPSVPFTMHDAYDYKPVLEKLPLHIEAIACYGNANAVVMSWLIVKFHVYLCLTSVAEWY